MGLAPFGRRPQPHPRIVHRQLIEQRIGDGTIAGLTDNGEARRDSNGALAHDAGIGAIDARSSSQA